MRRRSTPGPAVARYALLCVSFALAGCHATREPSPLPAVSRQVVVVTTPDWDAPDGTLRAYARDGAGWTLALEAPVSVGRAGSAWGLGLHAPQQGAQKREGDGRAPAGAFRIGTAFGHAAHADVRWPYAAMDAGDWCIDVPDSPYYNRIVDAKHVGREAIAGSTEPMRRDLHADGDMRYEIGFVIKHNPDAKPGAGSCIFAHVWKAPGEATAGCTAMDAAATRALVAWLDPAAQPVFVLLPEPEYARLRTAWDLP